jgi:hypothetical protein
MANGMERSPRRRIAWWVVPVGLVFGAVAFLGTWHVYHDAGPFHVGSCFQMDGDTGVVPVGGLRQVSGRAKVVNCGTSHDAEITRTADDSSDCASDGAWLDSRGQLYCVGLSG